MTRKRNADVWEASEFALDESTIPHKKPTAVQAAEAERMGDPIPHHFIPRKPNPNCILSWTVATKSDATGIPFVFDFFFDLSKPGISGREACISFCEKIF